jgi:hypothetical protein
MEFFNRYNKKNFPRKLFVNIDYASVLLQKQGTNYYLIHGGISQDFKAVYSEIYLINLSELQTLSVSQINPIA